MIFFIVEVKVVGLAMQGFEKEEWVLDDIPPPPLSFQVADDDDDDDDNGGLDDDFEDVNGTGTGGSIGG